MGWEEITVLFPGSDLIFKVKKKKASYLFTLNIKILTFTFSIKRPMVNKCVK